MKRLFALGVTVALLAAILLKVDRAALLENLRAIRPVLFAIAMFLFIPQNFISVLRWKMMAGNFIPMGWGESAKLILASQTMNIVLPSKMGDLTKAYFLNRSGALDLPRATNLVVFEKMLDLASLSLLAVLGVVAAHLTGLTGENPVRFALLSAMTVALGGFVLIVVASLYFVPAERLPFYAAWLRLLASKPKLNKVHTLFASSHEVIGMLQRKEARRGVLVALSILLWVLHLLQIYLFFLCLNAPVPVLAFSSLMPLAIFIGLLPLSLFGMGTRDAAIIFLFSPYHPPAILAGVGLFVSLRYIVPSLTGLPFLHHYLGMRARGKAGVG